MSTYYYSVATEQSYSSDQMLGLFGIDTETYSLEVITFQGFYPVIETKPDFDTLLYSGAITYTVVGTEAIMQWAPVPRPLDEAKLYGSMKLKIDTNAQISELCSECNFSPEILTAVASQDPADRPSRYQAELDEMTAISNQLDSNLAAIDSATSVDEINNIINKPAGIINTGRGSGLGPEDLNPSYYTAFNSVSMTPEQTELYVPGTDTVIPYTTELPPPYTFDSMGDCFTEGNYLIQIREVATSMVIAEFEVPYNPEGQDVSF